MSTLDRLAGSFLFHRAGGRAARSYLGRRFPASATRRLLIYYNPLNISWAQVYPFLFYARELLDTYGVHIRCVPVEAFLQGRAPSCGDADLVLVQPWFTVAPSALEQAFDQLKQRMPQADVSFVDSYAHTDLRLGRIVDPYIKYYIKKSLLKDRDAYFRAFRGDTNLAEFYGDLYGLEKAPVDWKTPASLIPKLRLSPNFHCAPYFLDRLAEDRFTVGGARILDIQTRLGCNGNGWYFAMRQDALDQIGAVPDVSISAPGKLSYADYMREMQSARICFSPFGYGELCWRDIEAVCMGAVLLKPDMDHLETLPNLYQKGVTYQPVAWDFSDVAEAVEVLLSDPEGMVQKAGAAFACLSEHVKSKQFVRDVRFLFDAQA